MYETDSVPAHWVDLCNDENLVDEVRQTVPLPFSPVCSTVTVCFPRHAHCLGPDLIDGCATPTSSMLRMATACGAKH
jgi:hypothetical protein